MTNDSIITPDTKIYDLLKAYPYLEEKLIELIPVFVKLKNPVLRKTITRVTTLKQASVIGKININDLIRFLRKETGQESVEFLSSDSMTQQKPIWLEKGKIITEYDAREDLENGIHPVNKVISETLKLKKDEIYLLITGFIPSPLIDTSKEKGINSYFEEREGLVYTYFTKI